jgi:hypothetical protein
MRTSKEYHSAWVENASTTLQHEKHKIGINAQSQQVLKQLCANTNLVLL